MTLHLDLADYIEHVEEAAQSMRIWQVIAEQLLSVKRYSDHCRACFEQRILATVYRYIGGDCLSEDVPAILAILRDTKQHQCEKHINETATDRITWRMC